MSGPLRLIPAASLGLRDDHRGARAYDSDTFCDHDDCWCNGGLPGTPGFTVEGACADCAAHEATIAALRCELQRLTRELLAKRAPRCCGTCGEECDEHACGCGMLCDDEQCAAWKAAEDERDTRAELAELADAARRADATPFAKRAAVLEASELGHEGDNGRAEDDLGLAVTEREAGR